MRYRIGDICIEWCSDLFTPVRDEFMENFRDPEEKEDAGFVPDDIIRITCTSSDFQFLGGEQYLYKDGTLERYRIGGEEWLIFHWGTLRFAYGYRVVGVFGAASGVSGAGSRAGESGEIRLLVNPAIREQVDLTMSRLLSTISLHSVYLNLEGLVLHASYIEHEGKAVLFTGHSGIGKSTQAALWNVYEDAEIINGDRALIRRKGGTWLAYGYPFSGSSGICVNRTLPLEAIVVLEQYPQNVICELPVSRKVRAMVAGTEVWTWDMAEIDQAIQNAKLLTTDIPVIQLKCRPDEEAVRLLKTYLEHAN